MFPMDTYVAKVVDNDDPDQNDKVQIYIKALYENESDGPWARPWFVNGGGQGAGQSNIPEVNSLVRVFFLRPDIFQDPVYIAAPHFENFNLYSEFSSISSDLGENGAQASYPDVKFIVTPNGILQGYSTDPDNSEIFIYHPSGSNIFIDNDGKIYLKAGAATLEQSVLGETLKDKLDTLFDKLDTLLTDLQAETHGTVFGPTTTPVNSANYATTQTDLTTLKNELGDILSENIKNN